MVVMVPLPARTSIGRPGIRIRVEVRFASMEIV
jgi:hypothetical protein